MEAYGYDEAGDAATFIQDQLLVKDLEMPKISITLGSGLKSFADRYTTADNRLVLSHAEIPHFPRPDKQASGHNGQLIIAPIEEGSPETMAIWAGRIHFYQRLLREMPVEWERITDPEVRKAAIGFYVAISKQMGIVDMLTSNAVGSSNPQHRVGDVVRVSDHLMDPEDDFGVPEEGEWFAAKKEADPAYDYGKADYFYGQGQLYSDELNGLAQEIAREQGWTLPEGVLNWRKGRGYETPAYTKARTAMGATLFGMSTAPEAQKARSIGFDNAPGGHHFAAFSLVSNVAQLDSAQKLSHGEVSEAGAASEDRFNPFMMELVKRRVAQRTGFKFTDSAKPVLEVRAASPRLSMRWDLLNLEAYSGKPNRIRNSLDNNGLSTVRDLKEKCSLHLDSGVTVFAPYRSSAQISFSSIHGFAGFGYRSLRDCLEGSGYIDADGMWLV